MGRLDVDVASSELAKLQRYFRSVLEITRPPNRLENTLPSVITSVDVKLAYDRSSDEFKPFIIGDINANPEGIAVHDAKVDVDIPRFVADRFVSNIPEDNIQVVVSLPEGVFNRENGTWCDEDSWLTQDKKVVTDAIKSLRSVDKVYTTANAEGITLEDGDIYYTPPDQPSQPIDGYVNLYDLGESLDIALDGDIEAFSHGANAPTAVWNPRYPWTNKVGLLRKTAEIVIGIPKVQMPRFQQVHTVEDVSEFVRATGESTVIKGPYGTWGDEVVFFNSVDEIEQKILDKERLVQRKRNWPDFTIVDISSGQLQFNSRSGQLPPSQYGHAEEVIKNEFKRAGRVYDVVDIPSMVHPAGKSSPIDFVPLVTRARDDVKVATVPSIMLRLSGKPMLNANASTEYLAFASLEEAFHDPVTVPRPNGEFTFDLKATLEEIAGREVSISEVQRALEFAGLVAFTVRNLTAFAAERRASHHQVAE